MERMLLRSQPQSKGKTGTIQQLRAFETGERAVLFLHWHDEAVHDVILPLRRVLAHVEIEDRAGLSARRVFHLARPHFLADELREFFRADFAEAFEPRDFRFAAEFLHEVVALGMVCECAPRMNFARSWRNISNGLTHLTPTPMHAFGIFIFFVEAAATSCVATV